MHILNTLSAAVIAMAAMAYAPGLTVTSASFKDNGDIPSKFSCEGEQSSPALQIDGFPATTKSFAIILHDPDAAMPDGFTHWVIWNIEVGNKNIPENFKGAEQGLNGAGEASYKGMCPPTGTHHYHFMVYALDTKLNLDKKTDKAALENAMKGHILAQGDLVGLYKKMKQ